ncbi:MAG: NnrS family protein [Bdellovibrionaceae bacterium]|nr:NnrS family protein [Pseudobdellovibrionaceae bacterium]
MDQLTREPYRVFFPIGLAFGFWGVFLWIFFSLGLLATYPIWLHSQIMVGGFLGAFAFGFLMTAIPRMTRSPQASIAELSFVALPLLLLPLAAASVHIQVLVTCALIISFIGLIKFAAVRFLKLRVSPPQPFVFIGIGLLCGLVGLIMQLGLLLELLSDSWFLLARLLFQQGFMLSLVLGVGSRLIPALLGWGALPNVMPSESHRVVSPRNPFLYLGALFLISYGLEAFGPPQFGSWLRAGTALWIAIRIWNLHRRPANPTKLAHGLWISSWCTILGLVGYAAFPSYTIHFFHLTFIAGLSLMTLMIASRVVLAHGGFNLMLEAQLHAFYWIVGALILAAVARFFSNHSFQLVVIAAWFWICGLTMWAAALGWRIFRPLDTQTHC